jgi:signal transduction histidine kinase
LTLTSDREITQVWEGVEDAISKSLQVLHRLRKSCDLCTDVNGPSVILTTEPIKQAYIELKRRGIKVRFITEITKKNIRYCKEMMEIAELRHLDGIKGNFSIADGTDYACVANTREAQPITQLIVSNVHAFVEQQQYFFETLWRIATPAEQRITVIEGGVEPAKIDVIQNPREALSRAWELIGSSKKEVLLMFSTASAFKRQLKMGGIEPVQRAARRGVNIRILIPAYEEIEETFTQLRAALPSASLRRLDKNLETHISILVIDREELIVFELKDDTADDSYEAIGISIHSDSKSIVSSCAAILESLWHQSELYERVRMHDKMQQEFINVAAHELRTPIQPLIGMADLLQETALGSNGKLEITEEDLEMIIRNAKRLERLSSDILEVSRIESQSLKLNKEIIDLKQKIRSVIKDMAQSIQIDRGLKITFEPKTPEPVLVEADRSRLDEVISNLLGNAIKFTPEGTILVTLDADDAQATVTVKDSGKGIDRDFPQTLWQVCDKLGTGDRIGTLLVKGHN